MEKYTVYSMCTWWC